VLYDVVDAGTIARITLNRPETRNAQNREMLVELGEAFLAAEADDRVRVVILAGTGPTFSSGHDFVQDWRPANNTHPSYRGNGGDRQHMESPKPPGWHHYFPKHP